MREGYFTAQNKNFNLQQEGTYKIWIWNHEGKQCVLLNMFNLNLLEIVWYFAEIGSGYWDMRF